MSLSNSQYHEIMRGYEQCRLDNLHRHHKRYEEVCRKIPRISEIDAAVSRSSVDTAKMLLDGNAEALSELRQNLDHLDSERTDLLVAAGFPADYLDPIYTCPDCRDTGYIDGQRCHCLESFVTRLLYMQSNLSGILEKENFQTLSFDFYSSHHIDPLTGRSSLESFKTAADACRTFVEQFSSCYRNILLYGDPGVGKTFLTHCIAKELISASNSVIYFSAIHFFDLLSKNMWEKSDPSSEDALSIINNCDLLIIDDLGTELVNTFTSSRLFSCINERILQEKSTVISTNLSMEELKSIYSDRIFSRISSCYDMLRITGDDIRIKKKLLRREQK